MTKQEEIIEGIAKTLYEQGFNDSFNKEFLDWEKQISTIKATYRGRAIVMACYLHSQGVVIKVKCPNCEWSQFGDGVGVGMTPCHFCNSTGYVVEPLIEEK